MKVQYFAETDTLYIEFRELDYSDISSDALQFLQFALYKPY